MRATAATLDCNSYRTVALGVNVAGNVSRRWLPWPSRSPSTTS
jgi:hypothetical protein